MSQKPILRGEVANVGTGRERAVGDAADHRINEEDRAEPEQKTEVAQRAGALRAEDRADRSRPDERGAAQRQNQKPAQTTGGGHEARENPSAGPLNGQSGTQQAQERPGVGNRVDGAAKTAEKTAGKVRPNGADEGRAMSQNGARISDFGES